MKTCCAQSEDYSFSCNILVLNYSLILLEKTKERKTKQKERKAHPIHNHSKLRNALLFCELITTFAFMKDKELTPQAIASRAINLSPTEENLLKVAAEISVYAMRKFIAWKKEYLKKHSDNAYN